MAIVGTQVSVTSAGPVQLVPLTGLPNQGPRTLNDPTPCILTNTHPTATLYLGGSAVSNTGGSIGYPLLAGQSVGFDVLVSDTLFGIAPSGITITVGLLVGRQ